MTEVTKAGKGTVKVTLTDQDTGKVLMERVIDSDYAVMTNGSRYVLAATLAKADIVAPISEQELTPEQHRHAQFMGGIGDEVWD